MSEFKREARYAVIKLSKIDREPRLRAKFLAQAINAVGEGAFVDCVVVEKDWPIYEETWENVQRLAEGRETFGSDLIGFRAQLAALKEENERLKARVAELEAKIENIFFEFQHWTIIYNPKPIPPSCGVDWDFVHAEYDGENGLAGTGKDPVDCLRQIIELMRGASQ